LAAEFSRLDRTKQAARACGIATDRLKIWIYGLAGLLFGLAGVMQMSRLRQGDPTVAAGSELDIIAAVVIGGGSLNGGEGTIVGSMIGALIMAFLRNGLSASWLAQLHSGDHHRRDHRNSGRG
jgi:ribose transport system permease protein